MRIVVKGWRFARLEDLLIHVVGGDWGKDEDFIDDDFVSVSCIRGSEFKNWKNESGSTAVTRKIKSSSLETRRLADGDVLIEISGGGPDQPVGRTVLITEHVLIKLPYPAVCTNFLRLARPSYHLNSTYLNHYLSKFYNSGEVVNYQGGSNNLRNLKFKEYSKIEIPVPSLAEQNVIADKLDTLLAQVETAKARLERIPDILKRFRQSVIVAAVSGKLASTDSKYRSIKVEDTWSHEVEGRIHWVEYKLSNVVKIIGGSQPPKSDFISEPKDGYIRLIQIRDYKSDAHKVYIPLEKAKRFVSKDDVMIGRYGPPIFQILRGLEGAYNVALMKAEPNLDILDKEYLYWYLQNYKLFNYIDAGSDRTAGQSGVNKRHLESYPVLVPPIDEQIEIVKRVKYLFSFTDAIEQKARAALDRANNLSQSILAKAFKGELTAKWREENFELTSGDNSAEALLGKIEAEREKVKPLKKARAKDKV